MESEVDWFHNLFPAWILSVPARVVGWLIFSGWLLYLHVYRRVWLPMIGVGLFLAFVFFEALGFARPEDEVYVAEMVVAVFFYGVILYIFLCELLLRGGARWLTSQRDEQWVKEIDYLYLGMGAMGIFGLLNRIDTVLGRYTKAEVYAALILTSAVVVRLIKTRAEIGGWNEPDFSPSPVPPRPAVILRWIRLRWRRKSCPKSTP